MTSPISPTDTGGGANSASQMNTGPFTTTNPFANNENETAQTGDHEAAPGETRTANDTETVLNADQRHSVGSSTNADSAKKADSDSKQSNAGNEPVGKDSSSDEGAIEKIQTATDEATNPVVEKVKNAAENLFHIHSVKATGPAKGFNPTSVRMHVKWKGDDGRPDGDGKTPADLAFLWRSRDNRKGRGSVAVPRYTGEGNYSHSPHLHHPHFTSGIKGVGKNLGRMFTTFPYWDMAFWSGWSYTVGSALFVMSGAFAWSPLAFNKGNDEFPGEGTYGVTLCFFIGALFYQIGGVLAYLEAVNDGSFHGSAMRRLLEGHEDDTKNMLDAKIHHFFGHFVPHPHRKRDEEHADELQNHIDPNAGWRTLNRKQRPGSIYPGGKAPAPRRGGIDHGEAGEGDSSTYMTWRWWPTWHTLRTHHVYEIGYLACTIQLFGVTLYGVTAIVVLPGILDSLADWQELAAYWVPQMVASACFLIASLMFMIETQEKWWKPEPKVMGWWIGFWSVVGSVGFEYALPSIHLPVLSLLLHY